MECPALQGNTFHGFGRFGTYVLARFVNYHIKPRNRLKMSIKLKKFNFFKNIKLGKEYKFNFFSLSVYPKKIDRTVESNGVVLNFSKYDFYRNNFIY